MKKLLLICLLSSIAIAQNWEYMIYAKGVEFKNKEMSYYSVINNNGRKVFTGDAKKQILSDAMMLKKYLGKWNFKEAYELDVLRILGSEGWELIMVKGELNNSNQKYYFKRRK